MRSLVLLSLETQETQVDEALLRSIREDQARRGAIYRLEHICLRYHMPQDLFSMKDGVMDVSTDELGRLRDVNTCKSALDQMSTYIFSQVRFDDDCDVVLLTNGETVTNIVALLLGTLISQQLKRLFPVQLHVILLVDQDAYHDPKTDLFMKCLRISNELRPIWYNSMNILPWEERNNTRAYTRKAIVTMLRATILKKVCPLLLKLPGSGGWIESVFVQRLDSPVAGVSKIISKYLMDQFEEDVLSPTFKKDMALAAVPSKVTNAITKLEGFVKDREREVLLPALTDLLSMMPCRDPDRSMSEKNIHTASEAWEVIRALYGNQQANDLEARLDPDLAGLENHYSAMREILFRQMLMEVIEIVSDGEHGTGNVMQVLEAMGTQVVAQVERIRGQGIQAVSYDGGISLNRKRPNALRMAKLRYHCLLLVYKDASQKLNKMRKVQRAEAVKGALEDARQYLNSCLTRLNSTFLSMRANSQSQSVDGFFFDYRLDDAYRSWCKKNPMNHVTAKAFYNLFTADVLQRQAVKAADQIGEGLKALFDRHSSAMLNTIRTNIESFFSELDFRTDLLKSLGVDGGTLNRELLTFLENHLGRCPLLLQDTADHPFGIRAKALVFSTDSTDGAKVFEGLAVAKDIPVISDPYEKGMTLIIKYAGNALDNLVVYKNNTIKTGG